MADDPTRGSPHRTRLAVHESPGLDCPPMAHGAVFFISDAHLGAAPPARETERTARLHDFLNSLHGRAEALFIVGDLFDFWFEYREAIPRRYFETLAQLRRLRDAGVEITYLNG